MNIPSQYPYSRPDLHRQMEKSFPFEGKWSSTLNSRRGSFSEVTGAKHFDHMKAVVCC